MKRSAPAKALVGMIALVATLLPLAGCGSNGNTIGGSGAGISSRQAKGKVTISVKWPTRSVTVPGKVVPVAANSIVVTLVGQATTPSQKTYTTTLVRPTSGNLTTTFTFTGVELGGYIATATAFPNTDATGNAQATGTYPALGSSTSTVTVTAGNNPSIPIVMFATVSTLAITPQASYVAKGAQLQLTATAFDSSGNIVITTGAITWTSSNPGVAAIGASTGLVTGTGLGSTTITAQYIDGTTPVGTQGTGASASITLNTVPVGLSLTASWAKFHGDAQNTGQASALVTGNATKGQLVAAFNANDMIDFSSPAVDTDGSVYVGSWDFNIYSLKRSGSTLLKQWAFPTSGIVESSPAISQSGIVYAGSYDGAVYALATKPADPTNVVPVWTFQTPGIIHGSPAIGSDGTVYIGASTGTDPKTGFSGTDNTLYALDGLTGALKWSFNPGTSGGIQCAPALSPDGSLIFVADLDGNMYCLQTAGSGTTRQPLWTTALGQVPVFSSPSVGTTSAGLTVFIGTVGNGTSPNVFALNAVSGQIIWSVVVSGSVYATPAIQSSGGTAVNLYVASYDTNLLANNGVYQLNPATGATNWQFPAAGAAAIGPIASSPVIGANGSVYFGSDDTNVYSVLPTGVSAYGYNATTGAPIGVALGNPSVDAVESSPGLGPDGLVYIGCYNGKVVAIQ